MLDNMLVYTKKWPTNLEQNFKKKRKMALPQVIGEGVVRVGSLRGQRSANGEERQSKKVHDSFSVEARNVFVFPPVRQRLKLKLQRVPPLCCAGRRAASTLPLLL